MKNYCTLCSKKKKTLVANIASKVQFISLSFIEKSVFLPLCKAKAFIFIEELGFQLLPLIY